MTGNKLKYLSPGGVKPLPLTSIFVAFCLIQSFLLLGFSNQLIVLDEKYNGKLSKKSLLTTSSSEVTTM